MQPAFLAVAAISPAQQRADPRVVSSRVYSHVPEKAEWDASIVERLRVPAGFRIDVFAKDLGTARMVAVGDDGTVYVTRRDSSDVLSLREDGTGKAGAPRKVVTDLPHVHGIAFHWELRDDRLIEVILNLPGAADLGYDAKRRLLVPLTGSSRVEMYEVP